MRVLFLSPFIAQEPLGVMYLSGALKDAGHETKMIFAPDSRLDEKILQYDPQVVCFSFTTGMHNGILGLNARVKKLLPHVLTAEKTSYCRQKYALDAIEISSGLAILHYLKTHAQI